MSIRLAEKKDLPEILKIYEYARNFMRENGNPNQWGNNYPQKADLEMDIEKRQLYLCTEEPNESKLTEHQEAENAGHHAVGQENLYGVFAFIMGADPTYAHIEQGTWKSDAPYGTIHRIAGNGTRKGVFAECMEFCRKNAIIYALIPTQTIRLCSIALKKVDLKKVESFVLRMVHLELRMSM